MLARLDAGNGLRSVRRRSRGNADGLEALVVEHIMVVLVDGDARRREVLLGPLSLLRIRRRDSNELCARNRLEEVEGVSLAHAAETGDANLELGGCHCGTGHGR